MHIFWGLVINTIAWPSTKELHGSVDSFVATFLDNISYFLFQHLVTYMVYCSFLTQLPVNKNCQWLDSNWRIVLEVTSTNSATPTALKPVIVSFANWQWLDSNCRSLVLQWPLYQQRHTLCSKNSFCLIWKLTMTRFKLSICGFGSDLSTNSATPSAQKTVFASFANWQWLDSNCESVVLEVTSLPTALKPVIVSFAFDNDLIRTVNL